MFLRSLRSAVLVGVCVGAVSCSLPPREAWQRMRQEGVLKAFFVPKRSAITEDRTHRLAGADLSDDEATVGRSAGAPVAEAADRPGYVWSPRTSTRKLVDVKDFAPGETVLCPYTLEPFVVPGVASAPTGGLAGAPSVGPATPSPARPSPNKPSSKPESNPSLQPTLAAGNPAVVEVTPEEAALAAADAPSLPPMSTAPFGTWVEGKPGLVYSPFAARHQLVDVGGLPPGAEVHCPFSNRIFRVPTTPSPAELVASTVPIPEPSLPTAGGPPVAATELTTPHLPGTPYAAGDLTSEALRELAASAPAPAGNGPSTPKYGATRPTPPPMPPAPSTPESPDKPKPESTPPAAPAPESPLPTATWAPNKPGLVQSPFGKPGALVDVTGKPAGSKVVCPYTNKPFLVPGP